MTNQLELFGGIPTPPRRAVVRAATLPAADGAFPAVEAVLERVLARGGRLPEAAGAAARACLRALGAGHVCVDFAGDPALGAGVEELLAGGAASDGSQRTPMVVEGGRLYLWAPWDDERRVAEALIERAGTTDPVDEAALAAVCARVFPEPAADGPDLQRAAVEVAVRRRLAVITGGPGTGKSTTIARLVGTLAMLAQRAAARPPRVLLLAPTGKAAQRLDQVLRAAGDPAGLPGVSPEVRVATVHRALEPTWNGAFRRGPERPLEADVVVVDETSMLDLALLRTLLDALPRAAHLVLVGDPSQLASVEVGPLLGDLCGPGNRLADCIVELRRSHRFGADTALAEVAGAIRRGDTAALRGLLEGHQDRVTRVEPREDGLAAELAAPILAGVRALAEPGLAAPERINRVDRVRFLCALKDGLRGVAGVGAVAEACARGESLGRGLRSLARDRALRLGDPVIVRRNDHGQRLYNGDVGVAVEASGGLRIAFPDRDGPPRLVPPSRLPPWEKAWALSVHQSQGSEFEDVVLVLPGADARVLTRELLYTAVTRARGRVWIHGSWSVLELAVRRQVRRASGLAARLRDA